MFNLAIISNTGGGGRGRKWPRIRRLADSSHLAGNINIVSPPVECSKLTQRTIMLCSQQQVTYFHGFLSLNGFGSSSRRAPSKNVFFNNLRSIEGCEIESKMG